MRRFFDHLAHRGDLSAAGVGFRSESAWRAVQRALVQLTQDLPRSRILDIGCGHGQMSNPLAGGHELLGLDFSIDMCVLARAHGLATLAGDACALPFSDRAFGGAIAVEVIQLIESAPALLREMARVVAPGGVVVVGTPNRNSIVRRLSHAAIEAGALGRGSPDDVPLPILRTARELVAEAAASGLHLHSVASTYFPAPTVRLDRMALAAEGLLVSNALLRFTRA